MNTKGNTKSKASVARQAELERLIRGMSERDAVATFHDFAVLKGKVEGAVYPLEFLDTFRDTAFTAITDYLKQSGAPMELVALVEDMIVLDVWIGEVEKGNGKVGWHVNHFLLETVASASRNIAACGGRFFSPHGETCRRDAVTG